MRKGLIQAVVAGSMLLPILRFVPVQGFEYEYGEQTTLGSITFRNLNGTYDSNAGIVNLKKEKLALFGGTILMDWQLEGGPTHVNAVYAKTKSLGLFYDNMFINGDPGTDPKAFFGLKFRILAAQTVYAGTNGGALTLSLLDQLLDKVVGPNNTKVILMSKKQKRAFKALVLAAAGGASAADVLSGYDTYDGAKIVTMDEDDQPTSVLPQTETRGSSNVTGSIYCFRPGQDPEGEFLQGLVRVGSAGMHPTQNVGGVAGDMALPLSGGLIAHRALAQVNTQIGDLVEMFGGLGVFHGRAAARLAGLT